MMRFFEEFPKEILLLILSYLEKRDLITASEVSREWWEVSKNEVLWQEFVEKETVYRNEQMSPLQILKKIATFAKLSNRELMAKIDTNKEDAKIILSTPSLACRKGMSRKTAYCNAEITPVEMLRKINALVDLSKDELIAKAKANEEDAKIILWTPCLAWRQRISREEAIEIYINHNLENVLDKFSLDSSILQILENSAEYVSAIPADLINAFNKTKELYYNVSCSSMAAQPWFKIKGFKPLFIEIRKTESRLFYDGQTEEVVTEMSDKELQTLIQAVNVKSFTKLLEDFMQERQSQIDQSGVGLNDVKEARSCGIM